MKKILFSFLLTGFLLTGLNTFSQSNIFIFFEPPADPAATVPGESISKDHLNETELQSVSSGFSNAVTFSSTSGTSVGKAVFSKISFSKPIGKSSAALLRALCTGTRFNKVEIRYYNTSGTLKPTKYLIMILEQVFVSGIEHSGSGGDKPAESISLNYGKITLEYYELDATGINKLVGITSWNTVTNTFK